MVVEKIIFKKFVTKKAKERSDDNGVSVKKSTCLHDYRRHHGCYWKWHHDRVELFQVRRRRVHQLRPGVRLRSHVYSQHRDGRVHHCLPTEKVTQMGRANTDNHSTTDFSAFITDLQAQLIVMGTKSRETTTKRRKFAKSQPRPFWPSTVSAFWI